MLRLREKFSYNFVFEVLVFFVNVFFYFTARARCSRFKVDGGPGITSLGIFMEMKAFSKHCSFLNHCIS